MLPYARAVCACAFSSPNENDLLQRTHITSETEEATAGCQFPRSNEEAGRPGTVAARLYPWSMPAGRRPAECGFRQATQLGGRPAGCGTTGTLVGSRPAGPPMRGLVGRRGGRAAGHGGGGGVVGGGACARCATHTARTVRFGRRGRVNDAVSVHDWAG
jgi:hypothetical protein